MSTADSRPPSPPPAVKICGVTRREDAVCARDAGAAYIGAVLVPSSPRALSPARAAALMDRIALPLVIVVADLGTAATAAAARRSGASVVQLHGAEGPEELRQLRNEGTWELWKAVRLREAEGLCAADELRAALERFVGVADGILVEGWHPDALGGTGTRFPWAEVAGLREDVAEGVKLIVAGGLGPENVAEAVRVLRPDVVDTSSGVERSPGLKDPKRVRAFVGAARGRGDAPRATGLRPDP